MGRLMERFCGRINGNILETKFKLTDGGIGLFQTASLNQNFKNSKPLWIFFILEFF